MSKYKKITSFILLNLFTGCGFRPIDQKANQNIQQIMFLPSKVNGNQRTMSWEFDKMIATEFNQENSTSNPKYQLASNLKFDITPATIQSNSITSRYEVKLTVDYVIKDLKEDRIIKKGHILNAASFDSASPFSNMISEEETKRQLMHYYIDELRHQLYQLN
jgi:hypothetical protein